MTVSAAIMEAIGVGTLKVSKDTFGSGVVTWLGRCTVLGEEENGKGYIGARAELEE
jgi:hypothetical protein